MKNNVIVYARDNGGCWKTGDKKDICYAIYVDVNGNAAPNKTGVDLFPLHLSLDRGIVPIENANGDCSDISNTNSNNCVTKYVLEHNNMDYLKQVPRF